MERKIFKEVEHFSTDKHVHVQLFNSERTKVLLLCLSPGLTIPPHTHPGFEVTLQPVKGKAILPSEGENVMLVPGAIYYVDGSALLGPQNPFEEDFEMIIHLIKK